MNFVHDSSPEDKPVQFKDNGKVNWPAGVFDSTECGWTHPRQPHVHGPVEPVREGDWIQNGRKL